MHGVLNALSISLTPPPPLFLPYLPPAVADPLPHARRYNRENQDAMARMGAIKPLVELLVMTNPIDVQAMAALAITEISRSNFKNQSSSAEQGAVSFLVSQCRSTQEGSEPVKAEAAVQI